MAYITLTKDACSRCEELLRSIEDCQCLGLQFVWLLEILLVDILKEPNVEGVIKIPSNVSGITINIKRLGPVLNSLSISVGAVARLEEFRNDYVHNGAKHAASMLYLLIGDKFLGDFMTLLNYTNVHIDFTKPL